LYGVNLSLQNMTRAKFHGGSFSPNRIAENGRDAQRMEAGKPRASQPSTGT